MKQRVSLVRVTSFKYLIDVLINGNLSKKNQVDYVITKMSKTIGIIAKLRYFVPSSVLIMIYEFLILPYLIYGLIAWDNVSKNYLNKIVILQKEVLHFYNILY